MPRWWRLALGAVAGVLAVAWLDYLWAAIADVTTGDLAWMFSDLIASVVEALTGWMEG